MLAAEEQSQLQAAQAEEQSNLVPGLEDALREAQQRSNQQRSAVAEVQQQIQVLAAESRSVDDQTRQLQQRHERLGSERQVASPDLQRLEQLQLTAPPE
jgi:chromosome segregation protein